ncbi:hypothetical protein [Cellulomonas sp. HZM]|uniref:hypothetical protein n=1 Tax=Cellulomonas sp. HZM TaxID=1454010 RepID=UPI00068DAA56|nr:hypothetical protein [Cellulomonas sp. HZM]
MGPTLEFSSRPGRWLTIAAAVACVVAVVAITTHDGAAAGAGALAPTALVVLLVWALYWRPGVEVSDGLVEVRNVWSTVRIPWPAYRGSELKLSLTLRTADGDVGVWAAPRESGTARRLRSARSMRELPDLPPEGTKRLPATGDAVLDAIEARRDTLTAAGFLPAPDADVHVTRAWHRRTLTAAVVLAVATVAVLTLG